MKIGIVGNGAMGKVIAEILTERGIPVTDVFDIDRPIVRGTEYDFDVAIDFSSPNAVCSNIELLCEMKKNIVVGTTGWHNQLDRVRELCLRSGNGIVYSSNFSVGMNIFTQIVSLAAQLIDGVDDFDISIHESHHRHKKDAPSGTAITLANAVLERLHSKTHYITNLPDGAIPPDALQVSSTRCGEIFGTHSVFVDSQSDTIELRHSAKSRRGLALGAVLAAEWICGQSGFFDFADCIGSILAPRSNTK